MKLGLKSIFLPLLVLAFVGVAVTFLAPFFTTTTRWLLLLLCLLYVLSRGAWILPFRNGFGLTTILFGLWSLCTIFWSEVPNLTLMKSLAFILVAIVCLPIGQLWSMDHGKYKALDFLLPLMIVALLAGVLGRFSTQSVVETGGSRLYQGLVGGPNMFGSMLAMCLPLLIWKFWQHRQEGKQRWLWLLLGAIAFYYLFLASSRAAILIVFATIAGLAMSLSLGKRLQWSMGLLLIAGNAFMFVPGLFEKIQQQYIYKQASSRQGVLYTREEVWKVSYQQALKGGLFGGGYGVTIGAPNTFKGGWTAVGYGREKGNSQLAILEETGLIGFTLYAVSLLLLFLRLLRVFLVLPPGMDKSLLGIMTGLLAGMLIGSIFEAWWVAPGSPEAVYFWCFAGATIGLANRLSEGNVLADSSLHVAARSRGSRETRIPAAAFPGGNN